MALFDNFEPRLQSFTPIQLATGADKRTLATLGYRADGSQNNWGKIASWIPGAGVAQNNAAQRFARNRNLDEDVLGNIRDDEDNRYAKLATQLGIIQGAAGLLTGNFGMARNGISNTLQAGASLRAAGSGPNRSDDGDISYW